MKYNENVVKHLGIHLGDGLMLIGDLAILITQDDTNNGFSVSCCFRAPQFAFNEQKTNAPLVISTRCAGAGVGC